MAWKKSLYLLSAIGIGALFYRLHVPAGWLIGALLTGICCSLYFQRFVFSNNVFQVALALVGTNIGFMLHPDLLATLYLYFIPLLITLPLTLGGGYLLGKILSRYSSLDPLTALFSCIPGGASEVIILSNEYDADQRIVAAFHTARITFFVLTVPFFVALTQHGQQLSRVRPSAEMLAPLELIVLLLCISSAFIFTKLVKKIPAGILFISMLIAFLVNQYLFPLGDPPPFLAGIGQAWLGAMIGIRFDRETLVKLQQVGKISVLIILLFFVLSLVLAFIFYLLTPLGFMTSLLSTVPAGAAEMSSTAYALQLDPTLVASIQVLRVVVIFLTLPLFVRFMLKKYKFPQT